MNHHRFAYRLSGWAFALPYLILFTGFLIIPLVYGFGLSFFKWEMLSAQPPQFIGLGNYQEAVASEYFRKALGATFQFVLMAVPTTVALALLIAIGIQSLPERRQAMYRAAFFLPTMVTVSVAGILWRWFFNSEFGLFNAYLSVVHAGKVPWVTDAHIAMKSIVFMTLWWTVGGPMLILLAGLKNIGPQYYEAASLDGATNLMQFRHITLPLLRPVLLFVVVMTTIGAFQVFGQTFIITRGGPEMATRVLVQYIYETAFNNYRMGYGAAMSWLLFVVIALLSAVQFRLMRER